MSARRIVLAIALVGLVVLFVGLAIWQAERRTWKHALIARVEQRVGATPVDAPTRAKWATVNRNDEYRHVRVDGVFLPDRDIFVQATTVYGSGYWLIAPLRRGDGSVVLINRGYVPNRDRPQAIVGAVALNGLLRITEPGGRFVRANDPARERWYSRDVQAMAAARGLHDVAPFFVDADANEAQRDDARSRGMPIGGLTVVDFPDNHLLYAIVWSLLAVLVAWATIRVVRSSP